MESMLQEGAIDNSEFDVPKICPEKPGLGSAGQFQKRVGGLARMRSLLPNAHYGQLCFHHGFHTADVLHAIKVAGLLSYLCFVTDRLLMQLHTCRYSSAVYPVRHDSILAGG